MAKTPASKRASVKKSAAASTRVTRKAPGRTATSRRAEAAPVVVRAEQQLAKQREMLVAERSKTAVLREQLAAARTKARQSGKAADKNAVKRGAAALAKSQEKTRELRQRLNDAKLKLVAAKAESALQSNDGVIQQKVAARAEALAQKAETDLAAAVAKFEAKWRKQREVADARALKAAEKKVRAQAAAATRKAQAKLRQEQRKAALKERTVARRAAAKERTATRKVGRPAGRPRSAA